MLWHVLTFFVLSTIPASYSNVLAGTVGKDTPNTIDLKMGSKSLRFEHKKHINHLIVSAFTVI